MDPNILTLRGPRVTLDPVYQMVMLFLGSGSNGGRSPVEWGDFPSIRPSVRPYIPPSRAQEPARQDLDPASQASKRAWQASEPASQASEALRHAWLALRPDWLGLRPAWLALGPLRGGTDIRTDKRTDGWKSSPSYRTLSPIGAAAPLQPNFNPKTV